MSGLLIPVPIIKVPFTMTPIHESGFHIIFLNYKKIPSAYCKCYKGFLAPWLGWEMRNLVAIEERSWWQVLRKQRAILGKCSAPELIWTKLKWKRKRATQIWTKLNGRRIVGKPKVKEGEEMSDNARFIRWFLFHQLLLFTLTFFSSTLLTFRLTALV